MRFIESVDYRGKVWRVGDRVKYTPNHVDCDIHPDIEYGRISSMRVCERVDGFLSSIVGDKNAVKIVGVTYGLSMTRYIQASQGKKLQ